MGLPNFGLYLWVLFDVLNFNDFQFKNCTKLIKTIKVYYITTSEKCQNVRLREIGQGKPENNAYAEINANKNLLHDCRIVFVYTFLFVFKKLYTIIFLFERAKNGN